MTLYSKWIFKGAPHFVVVVYAEIIRSYKILSFQCRPCPGKQCNFSNNGAGHKSGWRTSEVKCILSVSDIYSHLIYCIFKF